MPRVNINISDELKSYFEKLSEETGASQSALMAIAIKEYVDQKRVIEVMPQLMQQCYDLQQQMELMKSNNN